MPIELCTGESALVPTALRGYRTWRLTDLGQLQSTAYPYIWAAGTLHALCAKRDRLRAVNPDLLEHGAPAADCTCGIYGWYDPDDTRIVAADVFGVIEVTGRTLLGTHGFRASQVRLLAVAVPPSRKAAPAAWRELERQGVKVLPDAASLIEAYPKDDVSGLVDHICDDVCARPENVTAAAMRDLRRAFLDQALHHRHVHVPATTSYHGPGPAVDISAAKRDRPRPPRWKRWGAIAATSSGLGLNLGTATSGVAELLRNGASWPWLVLVGLNILGAALCVRLQGKALRW